MLGQFIPKCSLCISFYHGRVGARFVTYQTLDQSTLNLLSWMSSLPQVIRVKKIRLIHSSSPSLSDVCWYLLVSIIIHYFPTRTLAIDFLKRL